MEKKNISRRSFLKLFGAGTVATATTLADAKVVIRLVVRLKRNIRTKLNHQLAR